MTTYAARVELAERQPTDEQLDALVETLHDYSAAVGITDTGRTTVQLSVPATALKQATDLAVLVVADAARQVGISDAEVRALEVRAEDELDQETSHPYAAHIELYETAPSDDQIDQLVELLADHGAAAGINDYGYLTVQLDVPATGLVRAAERATLLVVDAARRTDIGDTRVIQFEILDSIDELERRSALPPPTLLPKLLSKAQAAEELGISHQQMNRYANDGRYGAMRIGSDWAFPAIYIEQEKRRRQRTDTSNTRETGANTEASSRARHEHATRARSSTTSAGKTDAAQPAGRAP